MALVASRHRLVGLTHPDRCVRRTKLERQNTTQSSNGQIACLSASYNILEDHVDLGDITSPDSCSITNYLAAATQRGGDPVLD